MKHFSFAISCLFLLIHAFPAQAGTSGAEMADAAQAFLKALTPEQATRAQIPFDSPQRLDWHNIPKATRKGIQLREMTEQQQELCHNLLQAGLSDSGYHKAVQILSLENNLLIGEQNRVGTPFRDPQRYFLTIFGTPGHDTKWGWSFEGHHLSLNLAIENDEVIGETPSFWGACPATVVTFVDGGPAVGTRPLTDEEQSAFDLVNALSPEQQAHAVVAKKAPADYRAAGNPVPPSAPREGLAGKKMTADQQALLWKILETYNGHFEEELSAPRLAEIRADGLDDVYFAWLGSTSPGVGHCYRVEGPTFVLELINVQPDPEGNIANHIHSVWRSLKREFGNTP